MGYFFHQREVNRDLLEPWVEPVERSPRAHAAGGCDALEISRHVSLKSLEFENQRRSSQNNHPAIPEVATRRNIAPRELERRLFRKLLYPVNLLAAPPRRFTGYRSLRK